MHSIIVCLGFAEYVCKIIQTDPHLGRGANILDSFSFSHVGVWTGAVFCQWILYGILVYLCCFDQACRETSS